MPITAIRQLRNLSDYAVQLSNLETRSDKSVTVLPGEPDTPANMWVPWSPDGNDFQNHRLSVGLWPPGRELCIWQASHGDGDFIRFAAGTDWSNPGTVIGGQAQTGGDRILVFDLGANPVFSMEEFIVKVPPPPNPAEVVLAPSYNGTTRTIFYEGFMQFANYGCSKPRITNVLNENDFPIRLNIGNGGLASALDLEPHQSTTNFAGNNANSSWEAWGPESGSVSNKTNFVVLEVFWECG